MLRVRLILLISLIIVITGLSFQTLVRAEHSEPQNMRPDLTRPGPWHNDVIVFRVSSGGQMQKLAILERAGVPTVARMKDGRLIAAYQYFPQDDDRNFDRVAVSFSGNEGLTWTRPDPIVVEGMEPALMRPFDPTLVPLPDGSIRLYFTSNRSRDFSRSTPAIYSAVSSDGVRYAFEPGVRFAIEGRIVIDCAVALHEGIFHIIVPDNGLASELIKGGQGHAVLHGSTGYHAISRDGLEFDRVDDVILPPANRWLGNMQSDAGRLVFFGTGRGPWPAISLDGTSWGLSNHPVRVPGADPGAVKLADGSWLVLAISPRSDAPYAARGQRGHLAPQ